MIKRIWTQIPNAIPFVMWDIGYEIWELKGGNIKHYRVLKRTWPQGDLSQHHQALPQNQVFEYLELLPESPIPLEAIRQIVHSWDVKEVEEPVLKTMPTSKPSKASKASNASKASLKKTSPEQQKQLNQEPVAIVQEPSYIPQVNSLFQMSSLSQWIPASALKQHSYNLAVCEQHEQLSQFSHPPQKGNSHILQDKPRVQKQSQGKDHAGSKKSYHAVPTGPLFI